MAKKDDEDKRMWSTICSSLILVVFSITYLALGVQILGTCKATLVPTYMIGFGATNLIILIIAWIVICCNKGLTENGLTGIQTVVGLANFIWLIVGSCAVFNDKITDTDGEYYCDYSPYMFAYVMIILGWIGWCIGVVAKCCQCFIC